MPDLDTVLTDITPKQVNGKFGPYTIWEFLTREGMEIATRKKELRDQAAALLGQPVTVVYEEVQKGEYTNRYLQEVRSHNGILSSPSVTAAPRITAPAPAGPTQKDYYIWRQTAAKVAVHIVGWADDKSFASVIVVADELVKYFEKGSAGLAQKTDDIPY